MLILGLDAALAGTSVALLRDTDVLAERASHAARGKPAVLAPMVRDVLAQAGIAPPMLDAVAVTVAEALAAALPPGRRTVWCAIDSRRGRVFLDTGATASAVDLAALPAVPGRLAITGDAAIAVAARLAARGADVMLTDSRLPRAANVARVGGRRLLGGLPALAAQPLYIDKPEARPPAGGLRPAPAA